MHLPRLGHAIIVNNVASEMPGSIEDVNALEATYKAIGFDVRVHQDCTETVLILLKLCLPAQTKQVTGGFLVLYLIV